MCAYRRFVCYGHWRWSMNGYYSDDDVGREGCNTWRILLLPDGALIDCLCDDTATYADAGGEAKVRVKAEDGYFESCLLTKSTGGTLEICEQSDRPGRGFTVAALAAVDRELTSVIHSPVAKAKGFDAGLMPPKSVRMGKPELRVTDGMQGGIYQVSAWVNAREPGYAYLKVFEATKNTPLSDDSMSAESDEYVGWSADPKQQFFYNREVRIDPGNWDNHYPARFELWFKPNSGKHARKLISRIYLVCGWQR